MAPWARGHMYVYSMMIFDLVAKLLLIHIQGFPLAEAHLHRQLQRSSLIKFQREVQSMRGQIHQSPAESIDHYLMIDPTPPLRLRLRHPRPHHFHSSDMTQNSPHALNSNSVSRRSSPRTLRGSTVHTTTEQNTDKLLGATLSQCSRNSIGTAAPQPSEPNLSQQNAYRIPVRGLRPGRRRLVRPVRLKRMRSHRAD